MTRRQTMDKIQRRIDTAFPSVSFLLVLRHAEEWRDDIEIHWKGGPEWHEVTTEAYLAVCPMEIERPRLCIEPFRGE